MTTEKALREALQEVTDILDAILAATGDYPPGADGPAAKARAALSLPETQGEPVAWVADAPDPAPESVDEPAAEASEQIIGSDGKAFPQTFDAQAWAKAFNETLTVLGHPKHDEGWLIGWFANAIMRGFDEANWRAAPPSQPAHGWKLVPVEPTPKMSAAGLCVSEAEHDPAGVYRAMLAAAPAAPTNGEGA